MFKGIRRVLKRIKKRREMDKRRRQSDYRATALAVQLVITGALIPSRRGVTILSRVR